MSSSRANEALDAFGAESTEVVDVLLRLGRLADDVPELRRARLNPVLVSTDGVWVLHAEVHVAPVDRAPVAPIRNLAEG